MIASYVILKYGGEPRPQGRPRVGHDEGQHPDRSHQLDSRTDQKRQERSHAHHQRLPDPFAVVQQFARDSPYERPHHDTDQAAHERPAIMPTVAPTIPARVPPNSLAMYPGRK